MGVGVSWEEQRVSSNVELVWLSQGCLRASSGVMRLPESHLYSQLVLMSDAQWRKVTDVIAANFQPIQYFCPSYFNNINN